MRNKKPYKQTSEYTCGPSSTMMALRHVVANYRPNKLDEYLIWRQANTIYMGEGHPGCSPYGLVRVLMDYDLDISVHLYQCDRLFESWTKRQDHKQVMKDIMAHDRTWCMGKGVLNERTDPMGYDEFSALMQDHVAIALTHEGITSHWVFVERADQKGVLVSDPWDEDSEFTRKDGRELYPPKTFIKHSFQNKHNQCFIFIRR